jgi:hypothetical protein
MRGVFCVIGAYTLSNNVVEVIIMIGFGIDRRPGRLLRRADRAAGGPGDGGEAQVDRSRVPGEWSEASSPSGTRTGTQRKNREAQYESEMAAPIVSPWVPDLRSLRSLVRDMRACSARTPFMTTPACPAGCAGIIVP